MRTMLVDGALVLGGSFAAALLVKATLTLAVALLAYRLARRSRAAARHVVLTAAFAVLLFLPFAASVIPSHVNEAATQGGIAVAGSRTARFVSLLSPGSPGRGSRPSRGAGAISVLLPLSGVTMEFNGNGRCEVGCQGR